MERAGDLGHPRLPGTPEEVDVEFMRGVLASNGLAGGVSAVRWERIGTERGISSMVGRARLAYAGGVGGADSLIVKLAPQPVTDEADTVEVHFYRRLAPNSPLEAPQCLFADVDLESGRLAIVLEDLTDLDSPGDVAGLDLERASAALESLAAFHARFAPIAESHPWAGELDMAETQRLEAGLNKNLVETLERSQGRLAPEQLAVCRRLQGRVGEVTALLSEPPRTLTHHDFRADNLFFRSDGSVVAVDWEGLTRQRGGFDVGMFLGTSLPKEVFAAHANGLIGAYADGVRRAGFDYPAREIERDVRLGVLLQLVWASFVFSEPILGTGRPLRVVETWLDRLTRAAMRLDAFEALGAA